MHELKQLVQKESVENGLKVPEDDHFYLMFLRSGMMNPVDGFSVMKNYFMLKMNSSRYFEGSTQLERLVTEVFSQKIHCMLPYRDHHGRRIYVFRPGRWDPAKVPFFDMFCVGYMLSELVIREERTQ